MWLISGVKSEYMTEKERIIMGKKEKSEWRKIKRMRRRTNLIPASPSIVPFIIAWGIFGIVIRIVVFLNRRV